MRNSYGRTPFGQGCLLARRLVEAGTRFVTVSKGWLTWDTHSTTSSAWRPAAPRVRHGLLGAAHRLERGMLKNTLVVMCGEFGRTPKVNP